MSGRFSSGALAALALVATMGVAAAQAPAGAPPICIRLETQLATLDNQKTEDMAARLEESIARQRAELDRSLAMARSYNCGSGFIFGPQPEPQCRELEPRITAQRQNLDRMMMQLQQSRGGSGLREARRREIIGALAQNGCGAQYTAAAPAQRAPQQQQSGGLFGLLFGGSRNAPPEEWQGTEGPPPVADVPKMSTFRTVCVRTCDGFFFPISYSTVASKFASDETVCRRTCPGAEAVLVTYPTSGTIEQGVTSTGTPYARLPNAFRYQKEFVQGCSCKPTNMNWADAVATLEDPKDKSSGDIIVDEKRARQMSQPQAVPAAGQRPTPAPQRTGAAPAQPPAGDPLAAPRRAPPPPRPTPSDAPPLFPPR